MLYVHKKSTTQFAKKEAGGKGHNLFLLSNHGFNVPEWVALPPRFFDQFKFDNQLVEYIENIVLDQHLGLAEVAEKIRAKIVNAPFSKELEFEIEKIYQKLNCPLISVRSSAHDEDSATHSFAGQLSSFLYVSSFDVTKQSIKEVWASAYSERSLHYRLTNKLSTTNIKVSVILQAMIDPEKSGVLFTCHPIDGKNDRVVLNSVYGVGEGLVSGLLDADNFVIEKESYKTLETNIVEKKTKLVRDREKQTCIESSVEEKLQHVSSLSGQELKELAQIGERIEKFYGRAQDVEWAIFEGKIYILQSRPVTTKTFNRQGHLYIWDNSNIVESYGGLTMPLTFGFARYVYRQVYVQFCEILMVPNKNIRDMDFYLSNMLGLFYGRVYYNILNWYKLTSILPGYKYNRSFMETMMGTNHALQDEIADRVKAPAFQNGPGAFVRKVLTGFKFFYYHLNIQNVVDNFLKDFHPIYDRYRHIDYSRMTADQIYLKYQDLEREMLWKWHAPIINDFLCMVHYGIFKKLTSKWLSHLGDSFHNDLLAGNGKLESAEPTKRLIIMAGYVSKISSLKDLILKTPNEECLEAINQSKHQDFYQQVQQYLDKYGFRCMSEMKLEQKDMLQDPGLFFAFLKNILNAGQTDLEEYEKREKEIRQKAESLLDQNLSGLKKFIYSWSLKHARKAVMNRENTRFCRTRVYGVVRAMFYAIGEDFTKRNIIDCKEDIFYLSLEELRGACDGHNSILNLRKVVELRKNEYEQYKATEPAARFATRGPVYWDNIHIEVEEENPSDEELAPNQIKGLPCSPGLVEGVVKVILDPSDNLELNGEILVTHRTDPGWIPLYPSISGLLVERGGLLSHSAIVAREMGLPTVVSIKGLTKKLQTGMKIRMNGESGLIEIIE